MSNDDGDDKRWQWWLWTQGPSYYWIEDSTDNNDDSTDEYDIIDNEDHSVYNNYAEKKW